MVIDLRYHLTTIIAIFLSLGLGILIGTTMVGDDGIVMEQHQLISQIENDLANLRSQNNQFRTQIDSLHAALTEQDQFIDLLFVDAIGQKMVGLNCLWVVDEKKEDKRKSYLQEMLTVAGVEITEYGTENRNLDREGADLAEWDFCILFDQQPPARVRDMVPSDKIFQPLLTGTLSKKEVYQFITSIKELGFGKEEENQSDFSSNTSL